MIKLNLPETAAHTPNIRSCEGAVLLARAKALCSKHSVENYLDPVWRAGIRERHSIHAFAVALTQGASLTELAKFGFEKFTFDSYTDLAKSALFSNRTALYLELAEKQNENVRFSMQSNLLLAAIAEGQNAIVEEIAKTLPLKNLRDTLFTLNTSHHTSSHARPNLEGCYLALRTLYMRDTAVYDAVKAEIAETMAGDEALSAVMAYIDGETPLFKHELMRKDFLQNLKTLQRWREATGEFPHIHLLDSDKPILILNPTAYFECLKITPGAEDAAAGLIFFGTAENYARFLLRWHKPKQATDGWYADFLSAGKGGGSMAYFLLAGKHSDLMKDIPDPLYWRRWGEVLMKYGPRGVPLGGIFGENGPAVLAELEQKTNKPTRPFSAKP